MRIDDKRMYFMTPDDPEWEKAWEALGFITGDDLAQEHEGSGTPNKDALRTGRAPRPPKCFSITSGEMNTDRIPAKRNPKSR